MQTMKIAVLLLLATGGLARAQALTGSSITINGPGPNSFANDGGSPRLSIFPVAPTTGDAYTSPDALQLGGSAEWASGQLTIRGAPYGYYDTGALLSMATTDAPLTNMRAGINAGYNIGPAAMATDADFDMVSLYNQTISMPPRIAASSAITNSVARSVTYTATTINFSPALSAAQLSLLRRSMWVLTNSIDLRVTSSSLKLTTSALAGIANGDAVSVTSTGTMPAGITSGQTYYAAIEYNNLYLASSAANAAAGSPITITTAGSGIITVADATSSTTAAATVNLYVAATTTLPVVNYYGSTIKSWSTDGTSITVAGWTVPGQGNVASGQVPPVDAANLDTVRSSYSAAAVFIGGPTKAFLNNWVQIYSPDPSSSPDVNGGASYAVPNNHNSQIQQFEGLELDQLNYGTQDYAASFHGLTIGYSPLGTVGYGTSKAHGVLPTSDSYDMMLAGPMPNMLEFNEPPTANVIKATALLVRGNVSVAPAINSTSEMMETSKLIDYNNLRLMTWVQRDAVGTGVNYGSLRVGLMVDGTQGNFDGSLQGQMVFNPPGYSGGIGFCGYNTHCNLYVQGDGNVSLGNGSIFIMRTPTGGLGGTINTDAAGDTVIGGALVTSSPINAAGGINVTGGNVAVTNNLTANALYSQNQIEIGRSASLWFQTSKGAIAGTVSSDDAGDVLFGTQVGGGAVISEMPLTAQNGLAVNGNATVNGGLTAGVATITNSLTANALYSKNQIEVGRSASLWFQTSKGTIAGTFSSDDAGDVLFGTQVSGGAAISQMPFVAQAGITVSGGTLTSSTPVQFAVYAYATLPAVGAAGREVFCNNCRRPSEAAGAGTGMMVFDNGHSNWVSMAGTVAAD